MAYLGNVPKTSNFAIDTFNGDGATVNLTLRDAPVFDDATQRCGEGAPEQVNGQWRMTWVVRDATPEEIEIANVVGTLCENNDWFAKDRNLPKGEIGDVFVIYDTGAHSHSMGFQS